MSQARIMALVLALFLSAACGSAWAAAERKKEATPLDSLIYLPPVTLAVVENHRLTGMLVVEISINAPDRPQYDLVKRQLPRIQDRFLKVLNAYASNEAQINRVPHVARISGRLQAALNDIMGGPGARLLMSNIKFQRRR